jgi:hypothetical protein
MNVTTEIARTHIMNMENHVNDVLTELIFNIDEVGSQEWADRKLRKVIIPRQLRSVRIEYSVPKSQKRMNCIAVISMAGDIPMPLPVIHRKSIDCAIWEEGWREGQDFFIRSNDTSHVTRDIFNEYSTKVILEYVATTGRSLNLGNSPAILLCDNWVSHCDVDIKELPARGNVRLVTFLPYRSPCSNRRIWLHSVCLSGNNEISRLYYQ